MAPILSHPFRITPAGAAATVDQAGDDANAEQLALLVATRRGERSLVPQFGLPDPAFDRIEPTELAAQVARWGPPVSIESVDIEPVGPGALRVRVTFR